MRYLLFTLTVISSVLIGSPALATTYPLVANIDGQKIIVTMTGVSDTLSDFELFDGGVPVPGPGIVSTGGMVKKAVNGSVVWEISGTAFKNDYTYYLNGKKLPSGLTLTPEAVTNVLIFKTGTGGTANNFYQWPIVSGATGQKATVAGKIDLNKYPNVSNLKIELVLSLNPGFSNAVKYNSHKTSGGTEEGVSSDGTYFWSLGTQTPTLTPSTTYYIQQNIYEGNSLLATKSDKFDSSKGYLPEGSQAAEDDFNSRSYHLLAPWPGLAVLMDPDLCLQQKAEGKIGKDAICDINGFLNFAFKTLIGLTAVALVLRLIYEGYQYMVTDVPFLKASAKSGFFTALLGLLLALAAYLILNTINPKLVTNDVSIAGVSVGIEEFTISGSLSSSFNAPPVKIRFNDQAYPAAKKAAEKTGVKATLILAIFDQETGSGLNGIKSTGQCRINEPKANPYPADVAALNQIATELGRSVNDLPVSCTFANANGIYQGHGGAIGYAQALPTTWNTYKNEAKQLLGKSGALDPWNVDDALMFIAVFMKHQGGIASPYQGACKYFGKCSFGGVDYAAQVVSRMATFEKEIEKKKAAGLIK